MTMVLHLRPRPCSTTRMSIASCRVVGPRRRHPLGRLPPRLLPAGARPLAAVPPAVLAEAGERLRAGKLRFFTNLANLAEPQAFARRLRELKRLDWVVYAKPPFGGPEQVLAYLGRYTHRVAIANSRLLSLADGKIRFTWKDYRADGKTKVMTLDADEFIRRFLLHALPDGFHRIRHYGFSPMAPAVKPRSLSSAARSSCHECQPRACRQSHPRRSPAHRC